MPSVEQIMREIELARPAHRAQYDDQEWAKAQPKGPPSFGVGDIVEFRAGGFGVITEVNEPHGGWPSSYATEDADGFPPYEVSAWHYEGDFKAVQRVACIYGPWEVLPEVKS